MQIHCSGSVITECEFDHMMVGLQMQPLLSCAALWLQWLNWLQSCAMRKNEEGGSICLKLTWSLKLRD